MGRPKGGKNKYWSTEEKLRIVMRVESGEEAYRKIAIEEGVFAALLSKWVKEYREREMEGITNKRNK